MAAIVPIPLRPMCQCPANASSGCTAPLGLASAGGQKLKQVTVLQHGGLFLRMGLERVARLGVRRGLGRGRVPLAVKPLRAAAQERRPSQVVASHVSR